MALSKGLRSNKGPSSPPYSNGPYEWDQGVIMQKPLVDSYKRYTLEEHFEHTPGINADLAETAEATRVPRNKNFEVSGTNGTSALATFSATTGGITITTATAENDQMIIGPHTDTKQTAWYGIKWGTENQVIWEAVIRTGASIAALTIWAGLKLTSTSVVATDDDAAYFRFDTNVANWEATTSIAGTDVEHDTGIALAINTSYYFRIEIDSDRKAHFFINNKEVYLSTALTNDKDLIPYIGVHTNASAAKAITVIKEKISRIIFE